MSSPNAEIDLTAKSAKVIEDLANIATDRLSETAKLQIIEVLEELNPNGLTLNSLQEKLGLPKAEGAQKNQKGKVTAGASNSTTFNAVKVAKAITTLSNATRDKMSDTQKKQVAEVLIQLDPGKKVEDTLKEFEGHIKANNPFAEYLTDLESLIKGQKMMDPKTDMKAAANAFSRASQKLENKMQDASREEKLLYKDFQAKLASLPSWEQQNRAFRAEGNAIRATIQEFLNLPGDAQIRSLMNRGAEKTGSTS